MRRLPAVLAPPPRFDRSPPWLALAIAWAACARPPVPRADPPDPPDPPAAPAAPAAIEDVTDAVRRYTIWFGGGRVGTAIERETWSPTGVVVRREESLAFRRGDQPVEIDTVVEIEADRALVPRRVIWRERTGVDDDRRATVARDRRGPWRGDARLPDDAIPAELVPLLVRRDGRFAGSVFLPARGFVLGAGRIDPVAPGRLVARLALDGGAVAEATIDVDDDGGYARVVDGEGVIAVRATAAQAAAPFPPLDVVAATAIPIAGTPSHTLVIAGSIAPPPVPGQLARIDRDGVAFELSPALPGDLPLARLGRDRSAEIAALVEQVRARIAPDLSAHPGTPRDATAATAGDCTTFALAYAALAQRRAIPTRVVTGLRIDDNRLVRHRWAVSWTGRAWIAVDAAYGAVPAGGDLVGLAVHDASDAGLVAGEAALLQVRAASWRR